VSKINKYRFYIVLLLIGALFIGNHFFYIAKLTPILRDVYLQSDEFPQTGHWSLDANSAVEKYVHVGMTKEEVIAFISSSQLNISPNTYRSPKEQRAYDERIVAYQRLRSGFGGWRQLYGTSYMLSIEFSFNQNKLEQFHSTLLINTL
jgi:hypothetical protein